MPLTKPAQRIPCTNYNCSKEGSSVPSSLYIKKRDSRGSSDPMSILCLGHLPLIHLFPWGSSSSLKEVKGFVCIILIKGLLETWGQYHTIQLPHTTCLNYETQNKFKTLETPAHIFHGHQNKHVTLSWSWDSRGHFSCCCLPRCT